MKGKVGLVALLIATSRLLAGDVVFLKDEATGETLGPIPVRHGERIQIGQRTYQVIVASSEEPLPLRERLRQTVIPELSLRDAALSDVIDFLREAGEKYAPGGDGQPRGVNIILRLGGKDAILERSVNMQARGLTLEEAINAIATVSGLTVTIDRNVVWLSPKP